MSGFKVWALPALAVLFCVSAGFARDDKFISRQEIRTTAGTIVRAHRAVNIGKHYTGDLSLSIRHQKFAVTLWNSGEFKRALYQTIRARRLSFAAIKANGGRISGPEWSALNRYKAFPDAEIDADFQKNGPQESLKDEDYASQDSAKISVDIDIK
jgi:hypothetical protein